MVRGLSSFNLYDKASNCLKLARETLPLFVYLFLFSTLTTIPKVFIEKMITDDASLGAYSSIFSIATLFQMATGYVYTPFIHIFATHYHQKDMKKFFSSLAKVVAVMLVLALIAIVGATFLGEFALALVFGDDIRPYSFLLNPILLSVFILSLLGFLFMIEVVIRDFRGLIIGNFVGFVLCIILTPVFISSMDVNGANLALIISGLASSLIVAISMLLKIRQNVRSQNE
jgi:O-antigen/teichoic acid export membrane protein